MKNPITILKLFALFLFFVPASLDAQYETGNIFTAARAGDLIQLGQLLSQHQDQATLNNALGAAVAGDQTEAIKFLVQRGADINHLSSWNTPLIINAIMLDHFIAAKTLIELGADITIKGCRKQDLDIFIDWQWTPLMCAARKGNLELVKLLVKQKANINETGWSQSAEDLETSTDIAAYSGHFETLKFLIKNGGQIRTNTLFKVVRSGHLEILNYILPKKFDLNQPGSFQGRSLLIEAAWWGHADIAEFLIQKKINVNQTDKLGLTALQHAKNEGHTGIYKLLKQNGAIE